MRHAGIRFGSLAIISALLLVAGCGSKPGASGPSSGPTSGASGESAGENLLVVGSALPMTGDLAPQGKEVHDGYELWQDTINAKGGLTVGGKQYKVQVKFYDYASDTNQAVKLVDKLITQDKAKFILGPYSSRDILAVSPVAEKYGMLHINSTGASTDIYNKGYKYTFGLLPPSVEFARAIVDLWAAQTPKPTSVGILARSDLYPKSVAEGFRDLASKAGMNVVYWGEYPPGTNDLTQALTEAKKKNPDVFFLSGYANDAILGIRTAKQIGFNPKAFGATAGLTSPDFLNAMKEGSWDVTTSEAWVAQLPDTMKDGLFGTPAQFAKTFEDKYKYRPSYIQAASAVAGYVLGKCVEKTGSFESAKVRECVAAFDENTFYGQVKFNAGGQISTPGYAVQIHYPSMEVVWPKELATKTFAYPRTVK